MTNIRCSADVSLDMTDEVQTFTNVEERKYLLKVMPRIQKKKDYPNTPSKEIASAYMNYQEGKMPF